MPLDRDGILAKALAIAAAEAIGLGLLNNKTEEVRRKMGREDAEMLLPYVESAITTIRMSDEAKSREQRDRVTLTR